MKLLHCILVFWALLSDLSWTVTANNDGCPPDYVSFPFLPFAGTCFHTANFWAEPMCMTGYEKRGRICVPMSDKTAYNDGCPPDYVSFLPIAGTCFHTVNFWAEPMCMTDYEKRGGICVPVSDKRRKRRSTDDAATMPSLPAEVPSPLPPPPPVSSGPSPLTEYNPLPPPGYFPHHGYSHPSRPYHPGPLGGLDPLYLLLLNGGLTGGGIGNFGANDSPLGTMLLLSHLGGLGGGFAPYNPKTLPWGCSLRFGAVHCPHLQY